MNPAFRLSSVYGLMISGLILSWLPAPALAHSAVEAVPRPDQWWKDRHQSFNTRVQEIGAKAQVIFIGDSITQGWENEGKEVWARYYAHRNAINLGISGDRTQHVLWRLDHGNLEGLKPKAAVLMIGTNNSNKDDNSEADILEGVAAIVKQIRTRLPDTKLIVLGIFPRGKTFNAQRGKILQVNQALEKLADNKMVFYMDIGSQMIEPDGAISTEMMKDALHPGEKGYEIWAAAIEPKLKEWLGN